MENRIAVTVIPTDELQEMIPEWARRIVREWLPPNMGGELQIYSEINKGRVIQHFDLVSAGDSCCATGEMPAFLRHINRNGVNLVARGALLGIDEQGMHPSFLQAGHPYERLLACDEAAWLLNCSEELVQLLRRTKPEERLPLFRQSVPSNHCADMYNEAIRTVNLL